MLGKKRIIWKSRKKEKVLKKKKKFKINELIILSGNILSWTVCVESSCFLTSCGWFSSFACPSVFLPPSVSLVVSWHLYSSEGWGRAERRGGSHSPADLCDGTPAQQQRWVSAKQLRPGTQLQKSRREPLIITAYVHARQVEALWSCSSLRKLLNLSVFYHFFGAGLKFSEHSVPAV